MFRGLKKIALFGLCSLWTSIFDKISILLYAFACSTVLLHPSKKDGFITAEE